MTMSVGVCVGGWVGGCMHARVCVKVSVCTVAWQKYNNGLLTGY